MAVQQLIFRLLNNVRVAEDMSLNSACFPLGEGLFLPPPS